MSIDFSNNKRVSMESDILVLSHIFYEEFGTILLKNQRKMVQILC